MSDDDLGARLTAQSTALDVALDLLEELVRTQWTHTGSGHYRRGSASYDGPIADLLVSHRPGRWEPTPVGLRWHPEHRADTPTPE